MSIKASAVALPLYRMFNRQDGSTRFTSHEALCAAYGVAPGTFILLSGTDRDAPLERWWSFGEIHRRKIIRTLRRNGIGLVTTPNYSLFIDVPRWDDLHAIKRIALVHHEFASEELPAALHVNGRTETDFRRWTDFVAARPEITHLAYEFTTGTGWAGRREQHAEWLTTLSESVGRPLSLVVRGSTEVLPALIRAFARVTVLETTSFLKTVMRQRASSNGTSHLCWSPAPTIEGAPIDDLLSHNMNTVHAWLGGLANVPSARQAGGGQ